MGRKGTDSKAYLHANDWLVCTIDSDKVCIDSTGVEGQW